VSEQALSKQILLRASALGARLFRQNTGVGWAGNAEIKSKAGVTTVIIRDARPLRAGLCKGSSDLIGWTPVTITPDMVGKTVAVFTAVEVKTDGVVMTPEQSNFLQQVRSAGGHGIEARDVAHVEWLKAWP
jgi:hypothetical protein